MLKAANVTNSDNSFLFIGDSRLREQFGEFVTHIVGGRLRILSKSRQFYLTNVPRLRFRAAYFKRSALLEFEKVKKTIIYFKPKFAIIGLVLWHLRQYGSTLSVVMQEYTERIEAFRRLMSLTERHNISTQFVLVTQAPVLRPWITEDPQCRGQNQSWNRIRLTFCAKETWQANDKIRSVIEVEKRILKNSSVYWWTSSRSIAHKFVFDAVDGLHLLPLHRSSVPSAALQERSNIFLNFYCNAYHITAADEQLCCVTRRH